MPVTRPLADRVRGMIHVGAPDECWPWLGSSKKGHAQIGVGRSSAPADRAAYELGVGPVPAGMHVSHTCGNLGCMNLRHMALAPLGRTAAAVNYHTRRVRPLHDRIFEFVEFDTNCGCWLWSGCVAGRGYGRIFDGQRPQFAHRAMYELLVGPIPAEFQIDHLCRVTRCVNPAHLEPVTPFENGRRSNSASAANQRKTHCKHGHPFDEANTRLRPDGNRACRTCENAPRSQRAS